MISQRAAWWAGMVLALGGSSVVYAAIGDDHASWGWAGVLVSLLGVGLMLRASTRVLADQAIRIL